MSDAGRARWWLANLVALLGLVVLGLRVRDEPDTTAPSVRSEPGVPPTPALSPASFAPAGAGLSAAPTLPGPGLAYAGSRTPGNAVQASAARGASRDSEPAGEYDICGIGRRAMVWYRRPPPFDVEPPVSTLPPELGEQALAAHWPLVLEALAARSDAPSQAAAIRLRDWRPGLEPAMQASIGFEHPARLSPASLQALATLAKASGDALVMQWAVASCADGGQQSACLGLTARDWLRIEPDNIAAWLYLLEREPEALNDALHGMAGARRADFGLARLSALVDAVLPPQVPEHLRTDIAIGVTGVDAALGLPPLINLSQACDAKAVADANRRQRCLAITELLVEHSRELLPWSVGVAMAGRLAWPADRLATLAGEKAALLSLGHPFDLRQPYSCASLAALRRWLVDQARHGELGELRLRRAAAR